MDDRQTKIREGAGLEDSRINQEFLDFLNKWSSPVLMTLAVAALIWAGMQWLERNRAARVDQAFSELAAATMGGNPSPASLRTIATEYEGVRSVPELALLTTSDLYLNAFVLGIEPGAQINPMTRQPDEADLLDEDQRMQYLDQAGEMARQVLALTEGKPGKALIAMQAQTRLAAVEEGRRDFDAARAIYEQLESTATENDYQTLASFARQRIENLDALRQLGALPSQSDLAPLPGEEVPEFTPEQMQQLMDSLPETTPEPLDSASEQPGETATPDMPEAPAGNPTGNGDPAGNQEPAGEEPSSESP